MTARLIIMLSLAALCLSTAVFSKPQLFFNANGYTLISSGELTRFSCLLIEEGKVKQIMANCSPSTFSNTELHDVGGKTLIPGMIDAHGHVMSLGEILMRLDLRGMTSKQVILNNLSTFAQQNLDFEWLIGSGWNQVLWQEKAFPHYSDIDSVVKDKPVWLSRVDGHAGWANKKAMTLAGITKDTKSPDGGKIVRDKAGNPTGIFIDNAMALIEKHIPKPSDSFLSQALTVASDHLTSLGITSTHDAGISHQQYRVYQNHAAKKQLKLRFYPMLAASDPELDTMLANGHIADEDQFLSIRSVKVYGDGALGSRGAALMEPYSDDPHEHGLVLTAEEALPGLFEKVQAHGFQLNYHAIGDKANRMALDHYQKAYKTYDGRSLRHRIEHAQVIHPSDIPRFSELGVIASVQPTHATSDKNMAQQRIGNARMKGAYAWQTLLQSGAILAAGSDYPVELANIFHGFHAAVTRQDRNNQPEGGWFAHESLSRIQAFKAFTLDAAYAGHQEQIIGSLETGKWADFIILDQDIFTVPNERLWKTQVKQTWIAGKNVYRQKH